MNWKWILAFALLCGGIAAALNLKEQGDTLDILADAGRLLNERAPLEVEPGVRIDRATVEGFKMTVDYTVSLGDGEFNHLDSVVRDNAQESICSMVSQLHLTDNISVVANIVSQDGQQTHSVTVYAKDCV